MLSIKKCRSILNQNKEDQTPNYSEQEVKQIRDLLYQLAELDYEIFKENQVNGKCNHLHKGKH